MQLLITAERIDSRTGERFKTAYLMKHTPIVINLSVAGWDGSGAGLSSEDYESVLWYLKDHASNIRSFTVELISE